MQMKRSEIVEELKGILLAADERNRAKIEHCTESSKLLTDFGFTSVGILYMVIAIEETFDIRFDDLGVTDFETLGGVVDYIEAKLR